MFKFGKPSISMGHLYHGYVSHSQMVYVIISISTGFLEFPHQKHILLTAEKK